MNLVAFCVLFLSIESFCPSEGWVGSRPYGLKLFDPHTIKNHAFSRREVSTFGKPRRYIDELSKGELFSQLQDSTHHTHDDVVLRSSWWGGKYSIPQAERYKGRDWIQILRATPSSAVLRRIRHPLISNIVWSFAVVVLQHKFKIPFRSSLAIHALLGSAMGLLLVFRNNAAYQRYWEGRTIWEGILGDTRTLARLCMLYQKEIGIVKVKRVANLICVFPYVLSEHLGARTTEDYSHLITRADLVLLNRIGNRPLGIVNTLALELRQIPDKASPASSELSGFSFRERVSMLAVVERFTKAIGACERLVQTPVPLAYARHTSRFLSLWCLTLPIALAADFGLYTVPAMAVVAWALFGIQEIGLMIEEPFRKELRLDIVTQTIYADVQETCFMHGLQWGLKVKQRNKLEGDITSSSTTSHLPEGTSDLVERTNSTNSTPPSTCSDSDASSTTDNSKASSSVDSVVGDSLLFMGTWPWQQTPAPWTVDEEHST